MNYDLITTNLQDLLEDELMECMNQVVNEKLDAFKALEAAQKGMEEIGRRFEEGEYFVGDLIYAGEIMTNAIEVIKPLLSNGQKTTKGRMLICSVKDDMHDIGKNIVKTLLEAAGIEVIDLGVNVSANKIIETIQKEDLHIVALSGVLTLALDSMKTIVEEITKAGLKDKVKIIIGGLPVSQVACDNIKADEWAISPQKTVDTVLTWSK